MITAGAKKSYTLFLQFCPGRHAYAAVVAGPGAGDDPAAPPVHPRGHGVRRAAGHGRRGEAVRDAVQGEQQQTTKGKGHAHPGRLLVTTKPSNGDGLMVTG